MITESYHRTIGELRERLLTQSQEHIRCIILYGARALGSASPDSDFDLLVVEADPVSKRAEMQRLRRVVSNLPYPVEVWVMRKIECEETQNVIGGLAYPAHKDGVVLYENA